MTAPLAFTYRGRDGNRAGHFARPLIQFGQALVAAPDLVLAREERGDRCGNSAGKDDAIAAWPARS